MRPLPRLRHSLRAFSHSRIITSRHVTSSNPIQDGLTPFTRRLFKLPSAPRPASQNHNSLPTFLTYASHISLPETSTIYVGTHYEYTVLQSLRRYALSLYRIGGRDDAGIDLVGTWHLPGREGSRALRVLVQCKALKTKLGPNLVRELEGAFRAAPVGWRTGESVGMLVSPREATRGVRDALARSAFPLLWMLVERDGTLRQALWNVQTQKLGLGLLGVETRYGGKENEDADGAVSKEVALTWDGCDIPGMDCVERSLAQAGEEWVGSWGKDVSGIERMELLDAVERVFPHGLPGDLSTSDRAKVLWALRERVYSPKGEV